MRPAAPAFLFLLAAIYVAAAVGLVMAFRPVPHSDWALYWDTAGALSAYERGGLGWWLLAPLKSAGLPPAVSALVLNLPAGLFVLAASAWADPGPLRARAALGGVYLCLLAPFAGLVQLDLFAASGIAAALLLSLRARHAPWRWPVWSAAALCLAAGVWTKPQYALLAWTMVLLLAWPAWRWRRGSPWAPGFVAMLLAGSIAGFAADQFQRSLGERGEALRTRSAVTLYAGLLVSPDANEPGARPCGYWSPAAAAAAVEDLPKPLAVAVRDRLAARPPRHWLGVLACKWPEVLRPPAFALGWLLESPSVRSRLTAAGTPPAAQARVQRALRVERFLYAVTTVLLLASLVVAAVRAWRRSLWFGACLPLAWLASYWGVHLVFEIQGRYFLGLFLLAPLVCSLALAAGPGGRGARPVE